MNKIGQKVEQYWIKGAVPVRILDNFEEFKEFLRGKVILAEKVGFSDETIAKGVDMIQAFLSSIVDPHNPEERLLQSLWRLGTPEEKKALSNMLLRLIKHEDTTNQSQNDKKPKEKTH